MRKTIAIALACGVGLFLGPVIIYDLVTDYRAAAQEWFGSCKPAYAKIHEAERNINRGTEAVARLKIAVRQMEREKEGLAGLLAQAPMSLPEMQRQHEALRALVAEAHKTGGLIEYGGRVQTPAEMENALSRQQAELEKYERYAVTIEKLDKMLARTEATISQALDERGAVKVDLEYARSLTRIAQATSVTQAPFEPTVGQFRQAEEALAGIIELQEVRLETEERKSAFEGEGKLVTREE